MSTKTRKLKPAHTWVCDNPSCATVGGGGTACVLTVREEMPKGDFDLPDQCSWKALTDQGIKPRWRPV